MQDAKNFAGRYLVFAGTDGPNGGMGDCIGGYDSLHSVERAVRQLQPNPAFAHIFDTEHRTLLNFVTSAISGEAAGEA